MRFVISFFAAGMAVTVINSMAVFWLTLAGVWLVLNVVSPGTCPHCRKRVKFLASTCHHCGKAVA
jgi:predicted amidophosphoribosyltransferase